MDEPRLKCFFYTAFWSKSYETLLPFLVFLKQKHASWCDIEEILIDKDPEKAIIDRVTEIPCFIFYNNTNRLESFSYIGSEKTTIESFFLKVRDSFLDLDSDKT